MKYTLAQVIASLPRDKIDADSYWTRWILRPLSFPAALWALNAGLSADAVTWISAICAALGGLFFGLGAYLDPRWSMGIQWIGLALLFLFSILDCADGNMARTVKKPNPYGGWTDMVGGYIAYTAALVGLGFAVERVSGGLSGLYAGAGGAAAAANMLMRAAFQSHRLVRAKESEDKEEPGVEKRLSENLGVTGLLVPAMMMGYVTGFLSWVLAFYGALYGLGSVWMLYKLARSTMKKE